VTSPTAAFTARGQPLTRYGIYKIVRRPAASLDDPRTGRRVSPHIFRHTAAVHLLEAGVEVNVIRCWLGHADLTTTNRYAEINTKAKQEALLRTEPPDASVASRTNPTWRSDETLLNWLESLSPLCGRSWRLHAAARRDHRPGTAAGHIIKLGTEDGICGTPRHLDPMEGRLPRCRSSRHSPRRLRGKSSR
jgi:Phage integrase family